jgi:uncharacterized protein YkwD
VLLTSIAFGAGLLALGGSAYALEVVPDTRNKSLLFYHHEFLPLPNPHLDWTGSVVACDPGTTSPAFRAAVVNRVNYFRALAGVPAEIVLRDDWNSMAQQAALMMNANSSLSHTPPPTWMCYTAEGATAAGKSNLAAGTNGALAVYGYMRDPGSGNFFVGHRRYFLYPQTNEMGTGDVPGNNALWVVDDDSASDPRPATREPYVAWPPPGYVPHYVTPARWSFSYPGANFFSATVAMTQDGVPINVRKESVLDGYGDNTIVWIPKDLSADFGMPPPVFDEAYQVTIDNVLIDDVPHSFSYTVTMFDQDVLLADFNNNKRVDAADLSAWKTGFGRTSAQVSHGDANRDGKVDGADFLHWQREAGLNLLALAQAPVPEPPAVVLGLTAMIAMISSRRIAA